VALSMTTGPRSSGGGSCSERSLAPMIAAIRGVS
jgi:hypothetical protein